MMGYITPITQFEYIQYANRTANAERQPQKAVQGVNPVMPINFMQELEQETKDVEKGHPLQLASPDKRYPAFYKAQALKNQVPGYLITRMTADLTGKGGYFNETI